MSYPCGLLFIPICIFVNICEQLNLLFWWHHNIYVWRYDDVRRHARGKPKKYFIFENYPQTALVYWSKISAELSYILPGKII